MNSPTDFQRKSIFSFLKKISFLGLGWISLIVGIIGIFTPILPTVPFLLVAAYGFSKGSPRIHQWLLNHKYLGAPIKDWEQQKIIRREAKKKASFFIFLGWLSSGYILRDRWPLALLMTSILLAVLIFIWTRSETKSTK